MDHSQDAGALKGVKEQGPDEQHFVDGEITWNEEAGEWEAYNTKNATSIPSFVVSHLAPGNISRILPLCKVLERRVFPKHESLAEKLDKEIKRRNAILLYAMPESKGDQLAGYALISWQAPRRGNIEKLCVAQAYRRQGVGRALCEEGFKALRTRGVDEIYLHVDPERHAAIGLYRTLGFEQHGAMILSYYCEGRHAMRMVKKLE
jgi:ribosomal protein S18 acetylase RimI-like enzyme